MLIVFDTLVVLGFFLRLCGAVSIGSRATSKTLPVDVLKSYLSAQGLTKLDFTDICDQYECRVIGRKIGFTGPCQMGVKCEHCAVSGKYANMESTEQFCQDIPPLTKNSLILATSHFVSNVRLQTKLWSRKKESIPLDIQWDNPAVPLVLNDCAVNDLNAMTAKRVFAAFLDSGPILHHKITFLVSVHNIVPGTFTSDLNVELKYNSQRSSRTAVGGARGGGTGQCPRSQVSYSLTHHDAVGNGQVALLSMSITIPFDEADAIDKDSFVARITCQNKFLDCHLERYRVCARIICPVMDSSQLAALQALQYLVKNKEKFEEALTPLPQQPVQTALEPEVYPQQVAPSQPVMLDPVVVVDNAGGRDLSALRRPGAR